MLLKKINSCILEYKIFCFDSNFVLCPLKNKGWFRVWPNPASRTKQPSTLILHQTWIPDSGVDLIYIWWAVSSHLQVCQKMQGCAEAVILHIRLIRWWTSPFYTSGLPDSRSQKTDEVLRRLYSLTLTRPCRCLLRSIIILLSVLPWYGILSSIHPMAAVLTKHHHYREATRFSSIMNLNPLMQSCF